MPACHRKPSSGAHAQSQLGCTLGFIVGLLQVHQSPTTRDHFRNERTGLEPVPKSDLDPTSEHKPNKPELEPDPNPNPNPNPYCNTNPTLTQTTSLKIMTYLTRYESRDKSPLTLVLHGTLKVSEVTWFSTRHCKLPPWDGRCEFLAFTSENLSELPPGDPRTTKTTRDPLAYEHECVDQAAWTCQSLLALGCVWSSSTDAHSNQTVTGFDPNRNHKPNHNRNRDHNPNPNPDIPS